MYQMEDWCEDQCIRHRRVGQFIRRRVWRQVRVSDRGLVGESVRGSVYLTAGWWAGQCIRRRVGGWVNVSDGDLVGGSECG